MQWLKIRSQPTGDLLIRTLCRTLYLDLLFPIIPRLLLLGVTFTQPWLIQRLLKFTGESTKSTREAVLLGSATAALYVCLAIFQSWYWQSVCRLQAKIRFCLVTAIYEKSLRSRTYTSPLTLMNVDLEKALFGIRPIHEYWAATSSILIALGLLYTLVGLCFLAPLVFVMLLATVSIMNGITIGPKQKAWLEATQARVTYISETLNSMKAIKLYGLVLPTISRGTELRENEVAAQKSIRRSLLLNTVISQTAFVAIALVTYCAFAIRTRISGQALTNHNLFTSLAILKLISMPMLGAVQYIPNTLQSLAALRRIQTFLSCDDQRDQRLFLPQGPVAADAVYRVPISSADVTTVARLSDVSCEYLEGGSVLDNVSCEFSHEQLHIITGRSVFAATTNRSGLTRNIAWVQESQRF
jgi:ATP-binding cassette subfamily C (CFTR/MRP) protein 1